MDKYVEVILRVLEDHHIKGMYDSENDIIYICSEEESGSVYNLFGYSKDQHNFKHSKFSKNSNINKLK
ncbi:MULTISPECIES: hypothetical protein [unclassified Dysgonomonas]|uniref:hypothetical protein n=1 Tax=unclassified Dysgonomonas TaxID=2630389 RepID=UPI00177E2F1A|nr:MULTISPECIES: hypothetical protein [unclassified Dysgonomonas]MBD8347265.1 hypothetical protein [Dysgonomonas sp. HGC4]MBF0575031.1 hypothetical protein [Dysgonomonas sp. GY617]